MEVSSFVRRDVTARKAASGAASQQAGGRKDIHSQAFGLSALGFGTSQCHTCLILCSYVSACSSCPTLGEGRKTQGHYGKALVHPSDAHAKPSTGRGFQRLCWVDRAKAMEAGQGHEHGCPQRPSHPHEGSTHCQCQHDLPVVPVSVESLLQGSNSILGPGEKEIFKSLQVPLRGATLQSHSCWWEPACIQGFCLHTKY